MPWPAMLFCKTLSVVFTAEMTIAGITYIFTEPHLCWKKSALTVADLNQSISLCPEFISLGMYS